VISLPNSLLGVDLQPYYDTTVYLELQSLYNSLQDAR